MPKRKLTGIVTSDAMDKTIVVTVQQRKQHPKYRRYFQVHRRYKAHDEENTYRKGDVVVIEEVRPLSRDKRWQVVERVQEAKALEADEEGEERHEEEVAEIKETEEQETISAESLGMLREEEKA